MKTRPFSTSSKVLDKHEGYVLNGVVDVFQKVQFSRLYQGCSAFVLKMVSVAMHASKITLIFILT